MLVFLLSVFFLAHDANAARVQAISYGVYPATASVSANHTLVFQTKSAISSGTIRMHLKNIVSSFGSVGINDIDLSSGASADASTATQYALAASAGASVWGVGIDSTNKIITFTYPASGGAAISAGQFVAIKIGTHAISQATGANQMANAVTAGSKDASLFVGTDVHLFSVGLFAGAQISIPDVNFPTTTPTQTQSSPPPAIPLTAVPQTNPQPSAQQPPSQPASQPSTQPSADGQKAETAQQKEESAVLPPLPPKTITSSIDSAVPLGATITWSDDSKNVSRATLERRAGTGSWARIADVSLADASFRDRTVAYQTLYSYRLKVFAKDGSFAFSSEMSIITPPKPRPKPSTPTNLTSIASSGKITLAWTDTATNEAAYEIQRKKSDEAIFSSLRIITIDQLGSSPEFVDRDIVPRTRYAYRVRALNDSVASEFSNEVSVRSAAAVKPDAIELAGSYSVQARVVTLSWPQFTDQETTVQILKNQQPSAVQQAIDVSVGTNASLDRTSGRITYTESVPQNVELRYRLKISNEAGVSFSNEITIITQPPSRPKPSIPANLAARADSHQRVSLSWLDISDTEIGFQLQRRPAFPQGIGDSTGAVGLAANATNFRDLTVDPDTTYQYRVRSVNESVKTGDDNYTEWVSVITPPLPPPPAPPPSRPTEFKITTVTATSVTLSWDPIEGEESVTIKRRVKGQNQFSTLVSLQKDRVEYIDRTVNSEVEYEYRILASNASGESAASYEVAAQTPTRVFDRRKMQVTFAPPSTEKKIDTAQGDVIESKSKQGTGVGIRIPTAVKAYVEGAAPLMLSKEDTVETIQKVREESASIPEPVTTIEPSVLPAVTPAVSNFAATPVQSVTGEINFSVRAVAPTASLVAAQFGDSAIIDYKPQDFASADGVGPLYVIGAQVENVRASARAIPPALAQSESFWTRVKAFIASLLTIGTPRAIAQSADVQQSGQTLYPDYQKHLPITTFDPALSYVFSYTQEEVVNVDERTIKLYSWNSEDNQWMLEQSKLDPEANTVTASLGHLTIFRLFGEALGIPASAKKDIIVVPSAAIEMIETEISNADLGLSETVTETSVPIAKKKFYTTPNTELAMCIPGTIFKKAVKKISLSIGSAKYPLKYDKQKDCYAARITVPDMKGRQDVILKIVYIDDQIQQIRLETEITTEFQARLLTTVVPAVQQVQEAAVAANAAVKVTVEKTEPALQTAAIAAVPMVTAANPAVLSNTVNAWTYLHHLILWLLSLLGLRKQRRPWGVVYNAITKQPVDLAIVRLFDPKTKKLVETQVTDKDGRFSFLPPSGEYTVSVAKLPLLFPSKLISAPTDGVYPHVYREEPFTISSVDQVVDMSIPLDPPPQEKTAVKASPWQSIQAFITNVSQVSLVGGFVVSILLALYVPNTLNTTLLVINWVYSSIQIFLMVKGEKPWGVVFDAFTLQPVPLAAISIFDQKSQKLLRTRLTDYLGRFAFLTPPGDYILSVSKETYSFPAKTIQSKGKFKPFYEGGTLHVKKKNQLVKVNVPLEPKHDPDIVTVV